MSILRVLFLALLLAVWQSTASVVGRGFLPTPSEIAQAFVQMAFVDNVLLPALVETLVGLLVGYLLAAVIGVTLGLAMGVSPTVEAILDPYVSAFYAMPKIALVPLAILILGIGFELRVGIVVLSAIFVIIVNTQEGVRNVEADYLDVAVVFSASESQTLRTVVLPGCIPFVFAGLRMGVAKALVGVVVAELTAAVAGLGELLLAYGRSFEADRVFVPLIILGLISVVLIRLMDSIMHRVAPWAPESRSKGGAL